MDIAAILPTYYGLSNRAKKERGNYICKTKHGYRKIFRTSESPQAIHQRYLILEALAASGFDRTDRIFLSTQNMPYINLGRETYIMTRHIPGRDMDFNSKNDVTTALEVLARFHKAAYGLSIESVPPKAPSLFDTWKKHASHLEQFLKQVNRSSRLSDFDVLFIKNASHYATLAAAAMDALGKTDYIELQTEAIADGCICHNTIKEENLPIMEEDCYITRLTEPSLDLQLIDLASFIHRYARRSEREIPVDELIEIYDRVLPLPASAPAICHAQLAYPWPFIKVAKQHYSKKRGWTPAALMSRMHTILEEQSDYAQYIGYSSTP